MGGENSVMIKRGTLKEIEKEEMSAFELSGIYLLPAQIKAGEYIYPENSDAIAKLFRAENLKFAQLPSVEKVSYQELRDNSWLGPIIFYSYSACTENPQLISISLGIISNYLTEIFRGNFGNPQAKLEIITEVERGKKYQRINYDGPVSGMSELPKIVEASWSKKDGD